MLAGKTNLPSPDAPDGILSLSYPDAPDLNSSHIYETQCFIWVTMGPFQD